MPRLIRLNPKPIAALLLLLGAGSLAACQHGGQGRDHRGLGKAADKHVDRMVSHLSRKLDLDESQKGQVQAMALSLKEEWRSQRQSLQEARTAAVAAFRAEGLDTAALEQAWSAPFEGFAGMRQSLLDKVTELHALLRPEQRAKLADLLERRWGSRG